MQVKTNILHFVYILWTFWAVSPPFPVIFTPFPRPFAVFEKFTISTPI